jgi:hypothetical protein
MWLSLIIATSRMMVSKQADRRQFASRLSRGVPKSGAAQGERRND